MPSQLLRHVFVSGNSKSVSWHNLECPGLEFKWSSSGAHRQCKICHVWNTRKCPDVYTGSHQTCLGPDQVSPNVERLIDILPFCLLSVISVFKTLVHVGEPQNFQTTIGVHLLLDVVGVPQREPLSDIRQVLCRAHFTW